MRYSRVAGPLAILAFLLLAWPVAAQTNYVIQAAPADIDRITTQYGLTLLDTLKAGGGVYLVSAPATADPIALPALVSADLSVLSFESDNPVTETESKPTSVAQPDVAALQNALTNTATAMLGGVPVSDSYVNQPASWLIRLNQPFKLERHAIPTVAVIDTGVDPSHPALAGALVSGYDFIRNQPGIPDETLDLNPSTAVVLAAGSAVALPQRVLTARVRQSTVVILDQSTVVILDGNPLPADFGHGTMVAGLIHLVSPNTPIMPLKVFDSAGNTDIATIVKAIYFAVDNGAKIINMSFDLEVISPAMQQAIAYARSKYVICVAAVGNEGEVEMVYPASFPGVIGVGSTTITDTRSLFSNYGVPTVDMAAPGEALITTFPGNNYAGAWGTSFSTALVSGTLGLMTQEKPSLSTSDALGKLRKGVALDPSLGIGPARLDVLSTMIALD